jgi:Family of unknown function (DUF6511)
MAESVTGRAGWLRGDACRVDRLHSAGAATAPSGPEPEWAYVWPCAICCREAKGFGYVHQLRRDRYPTYRFCSPRCLDAGAVIAGRRGGMIDKTGMEQQAIKNARRPFAEALTELGLMAHFFDLSAEQIDQLIEAAVDGFQQSMQCQALNDDVPW